MMLDDPRDVKGNIRLFRPIHLHLLLDDPRGVKEKTVVSFSASKGVIVFWTAKFFSHCLPHLLRESPYFLHISFAISLSPSHLLHHLLQFIRLSVRLLPCFEGDEEIFWENKHFRDQRAQRAHRPMGRMGRMGRHFFNTSRTRAQELLFSMQNCSRTRTQELSKNRRPIRPIRPHPAGGATPYVEPEDGLHGYPYSGLAGRFI